MGLFTHKTTYFW